MPLPFAVALKIGASSGFSFGVVDYITQVFRKKVIVHVADKIISKRPEEDEEENDENIKTRPISTRSMIRSFAAGAFIGTWAGGPLYVKYILHDKIKSTILSNMLWCQLFWLPIQVAVVARRTAVIEENLPLFFGKAAFAVSGGFIACDALIRFGAFSPHALHGVAQAQKIFKDVGGCVVGYSLFVFCNKFADFQLNKNILDGCQTVTTIHYLSTSIGQLFGNFVAFSAAAAPWLPMAVSSAPWYYSAMLIGPGFFYCTALNIESGIKCSEVSGREPETYEGRVTQQKRATILQILPLGALPSGLAQSHFPGHPGISIGCSFLAAACASLYIAYQQPLWSKYLDAERERFGGVLSDQLDDDELLKIYQKEMTIKEDVADSTKEV